MRLWGALRLKHIWLLFLFSANFVWASDPLVVTAVDAGGHQVRAVVSGGEFITVLGRQYRQPYTITFSDSKIPAQTISSATYDRLLAVSRKYGDATTRWKMPHPNGGVGSGTFLRPVLDFRTFPLGVGAELQTTDFVRYARREAGEIAIDYRTREAIYDPHAEPELGADFKYEYKTHEVIQMEGEKLKPEGFEFELKSNIRKQRFVLDFGKGRLVPVYVLGYREGNAVFVAPEDLKKIQRGSRGDSVNINRYEVPREMLRTVSNEEFIFANREYAADRSHHPQEELVLANKEPLKGLESSADHLSIDSPHLDESIQGFRNKRQLEAHPAIDCFDATQSVYNLIPAS